MIVGVVAGHRLSADGLTGFGLGLVASPAYAQEPGGELPAGDASVLGRLLGLEVDWPAWGWAAAQLAVAVVVGLALHRLAFWLAARTVRRTPWRLDDELLRRLKRPSRLIFPLLAMQVVLPAAAALGEAGSGFLRHLFGLGAIAAITWLLAALAGVGGELLKARHRVDIEDNLEARRIHTQITVLERTLQVALIAVGVAVALMTFPRVRELGASILVSAGFAGLAVGLAARPVLENLIAGLQLAFSQPIRIDDVVIVDGEWGRIEEITTTYVVVRIWDERRLVVPFSKFISESFQNWTRRSADILGTVFIHADYTVPVEAVRGELCRLVEGHEKWDGRVCGLQVTDATEDTVRLRALVSAANSADAWDLRVWVREKLIDFLQREYPECLPRSRVRLEGRGQTAGESERAGAEGSERQAESRVEAAAGEA